MSLAGRPIEGITVLSLDRYLNLTGWDRDFDFPNKHIWNYHYREIPERRLAIPASDEYVDYPVRLESIIETLSVINGTPKEEIIKDLKATYFDRLEFRIISPISVNGKLPLDYAAECIEGIKDLILYSACAVQDARPICLKATSRAKENLSKFELGQTEVGSFIINVDAKVVDENDDHIIKLDYPTPSIEHRIVERISTAIHQVEMVTSQQRQITDMASEAFKDGITANMCESFLRLQPEDRGPIELEATIRYASAVTDKIGVKRRAKLGDVHFAVMKEISSIYRDKTIVEDMTLTGIINKMQLRNQEEHTIAIDCKVNGGRRIVQAILSDEQHKLACDAYESTLLVKISGVVNKSQKIWAISEIERFEVLSPSGEVVGHA